MLDAIGVDSIETLFDEIPSELRAGVLMNVPDSISEMEMLRLMNERAAMDLIDLCFIGAGAYQHHIPSAVWDLVGRGEFMTAYTPYQAEASQGTLQTIYEFQTMMTRLTGMDVANASVYEGASALAEAVLMAVRANKKKKARRVLCAGTIHPSYVTTARNIVRNQGIEIETTDWSAELGATTADCLAAHAEEHYDAIVIAQPNFFGCIEDVDAITNWAHEHESLVIGVVNPISLALLRPPGEWGAAGADIVVGDAQPLGIPVSSGGPYCGFICCTSALVRQMPGRIIGRTLDLDGNVGYTLTLQAREQHIRRSKATSNICTNEGLLMTAATIYMSLLGDQGMHAVASRSHAGTLELIEGATKIEGVKRRFATPVFHEVVIEVPGPARSVLNSMGGEEILAGYDLGEVSDSLSNCILTNVTETKNAGDIDRFVAALARGVEAI
jgi:glycine dehydrogenase subunit 1